MTESSRIDHEIVAVPTPLSAERGSGKIRNTASYRIKEALATVLVGGILGTVVGVPSSAILSIVRPELVVYSWIPFAITLAVGASVALVAELRYQSRK